MGERVGGWLRRHDGEGKSGDSKGGKTAVQIRMRTRKMVDRVNEDKMGDKRNARTTEEEEWVKDRERDT